MKATKKQIAEVTSIATEMGVNVELAISTLNNCSKSIFDVIGAKGVVESAAKVANDNRAEQKGGILLSSCNIIKVTEKAFLLSFSKGINVVEKWVAKSNIKEIDGDSIVPAWCL